jgi:hypothetical protein
VAAVRSVHFHPLLAEFAGLHGLRLRKGRESAVKRHTDL